MKKGRGYLPSPPSSYAPESWWWLDVPTSQMSIFILFVSTGVLFPVGILKVKEMYFVSKYFVCLQHSVKENCHNCRTSDDIDMKLEPVTELDKNNDVKKIWRRRHVKKLWCHCHFSNLRLTWSYPEAGLWTCSL